MEGNVEIYFIKTGYGSVYCCRGSGAVLVELAGD
jgi:hypothetical protein